MQRTRWRLRGLAGPGYGLRHGAAGHAGGVWGRGQWVWVVVQLETVSFLDCLLHTLRASHILQSALSRSKRPILQEQPRTVGLEQGGMRQEHPADRKIQHRPPGMTIRGHEMGRNQARSLPLSGTPLPFLPQPVRHGRNPQVFHRLRCTGAPKTKAGNRARLTASRLPAVPLRMLPKSYRSYAQAGKRF